MLLRRREDNLRHNHCGGLASVTVLMSRRQIGQEALRFSGAMLRSRQSRRSRPSHPIADNFKRSLDILSVRSS